MGVAEPFQTPPSLFSARTPCSVRIAPNPSLRPLPSPPLCLATSNVRVPDGSNNTDPISCPTAFSMYNPPKLLCQFNGAEPFWPIVSKRAGRGVQCAFARPSAVPSVNLCAPTFPSKARTPPPPSHSPWTHKCALCAVAAACTLRAGGRQRKGLLPQQTLLEGPIPASALYLLLSGLERAGADAPNAEYSDDEAPKEAHGLMPLPNHRHCLSIC